MKITAIHRYLVPPRWCFIKIETDEGLSGWGEPVVEGKAETVRCAVKELEHLLIGRNPLETERLWQTMYRGGFYRGGAVLMSAIAGIDQALWDIKGKFYNAPVHALLGGPVRDNVRMYTWIGGDMPHSAQETAYTAQEAQRRGFDAIKMNASGPLAFIDSPAAIHTIVERVAAVREATGAHFDIALDFHGRVHKAMAKRLLRKLEPYDIFFVEEPVLPEHLHALPELASATSIALATGERMFTRYEFKALLERGGVSIVQPDISHAGGISECTRIASMAEAYDVQLALHCPLGPIALAAALHVNAVAYNALIQEQSMGIHYNAGAEVLDYVRNKDALRITNGRIAVPTGAGLGIDIDEARVLSQTPHAWRNPIWHYQDGAIAEW